MTFSQKRMLVDLRRVFDRQALTIILGLAALAAVLKGLAALVTYAMFHWN